MISNSNSNQPHPANSPPTERLLPSFLAAATPIQPLTGTAMSTNMPAEDGDTGGSGFGVPGEREWEGGDGEVGGGGRGGGKEGGRRAV